MAGGSAEAVPLPEGQPGRISGPAEEEDRGPKLTDESALRQLALEEAEVSLQHEMSFMLQGDTMTEVGRMCGLELGAPPEEVARRWAEALVDLLWMPMAGCRSLLRNLGADDAKVKIQLFWRCSVALCMMPLTQLAALTERKKQFCEELEGLIPPSGTDPAVARLAHVRLNLPVFAMTARLPTDGGRPSPKPAATGSHVVEPKRSVGEKKSAAPKGDESDDDDEVIIEELPNEAPSHTVGAPVALSPLDGDGKGKGKGKGEKGEKVFTAARHTYDVGYKKWERFDVEEAERDVDRKAAFRKLEKVDFSEASAKNPVQQYDDPVQALDKAIEKLKTNESSDAKDAPEPTPSTASGAGPAVGPGGEGAPDAKGVAELASPTAHGADVATGPGDDRAPDAKDKPALLPSTERGSYPAAGQGGDNSWDTKYQRWDKFDVDAALDSDDDDESKKGKRQQKRQVAKLTPAPPTPQQLAGAEEPGASPAPAVSGEGGAAEVGTAVSQAAAAASVTATSIPAEQKPQELGDYFKRWDKFDVDAEEAAVDKAPSPKPAPKKKSSTEPAPKKKSVPASPAASLPPQATPPPQAEAAANVKLADDGATGSATAAALSKEYQKWNKFDEEQRAPSGSDDDLDDMDEDFDDARASNLDLDALTGPKEEVAKIRSHWQKDFKHRSKKAHKDQQKAAEEAKKLQRERIAAAREEAPVLPSSGPTVRRPCEYKPSQDLAPQALSRDYDRWKKVDTDAMVLGMDNEGTTEEGNAMRVAAGGGSAMLSCEGYTKDREEYDLDQDIDREVGGLKKVIAQRLKDAAGCKVEGNRFMRDGRVQDARRAYENGLSAMELCKQSAVLMSGSMSQKNGRLIADLLRNLSATQIELKDYQGARESAEASLKESAEVCKDPDAVVDRDADDKARYRRALANIRLGCKKEAQKDFDSLVAARGDADAAVKRLRAELQDTDRGDMAVMD